MTNNELHFDELDLREEPARNTTAPIMLGTTACTTSDVCSNNTCFCTTTKYC